jgi:diamine N-acetyltransferase
LEQTVGVREFILPASAEAHRADFENPATVYLSILEGSAFAGFILLRLDPDGSSVECRRIVVVERGRGIGQVAIAALERYCRSVLGRFRIWLDVFDANHRARHVYTKLGFRDCGETVNAGRRLLLYEKVLTTTMFRCR